MTKPMTKLLAVAMWMGVSTASADVPRTLANGAPACGNTGGKGMTPCQKAEAALTRARTALARALDEERTIAAALGTQPRVLASGAPACGNTGGKAPECTTELADQRYDARLRAVVEAAARVRKARKEVASAERQVAEHARRTADSIVAVVQ